MRSSIRRTSSRTRCSSLREPGPATRSSRHPPCSSIPIEELEAAAANPQALGLPAEATSVEGFLFPATYTFDPGVTAQEVCRRWSTESSPRSMPPACAGGSPPRGDDRLARSQREAGSTAGLHQGLAGDPEPPRPGDAPAVRLDRALRHGRHDTVSRRPTRSAPTRRTRTTRTCIRACRRADRQPRRLKRSRRRSTPPTDPGCTSSRSTSTTGETVFSDTVEEHEAAVEQLLRVVLERRHRRLWAVSARRLAVLGSPIAHSQSPALHRAAYDLLGLDWEYDRRRDGRRRARRVPRHARRVVARTLAHDAAEAGRAAAPRRDRRARRRSPAPPTRCCSPTDCAAGSTPTSAASCARSARPAATACDTACSSAAGRPRRRRSSPWPSSDAASVQVLLRRPGGRRSRSSHSAIARAARRDRPVADLAEPRRHRPRRPRRRARSPAARTPASRHPPR